MGDKMKESYSPTVKSHDGNIYIRNINCFDLEQTLDCGQAFRWSKIDENIWHGIAFGKYLKIEQNDNEIILYNTSLNDYLKIWKNYFDIDRNYLEIIEAISINDTLKSASILGKGIRILKQDKWETLCSFIISQNNNIPRIKGIIERMCENFGEKLENGMYTFPTAEKIASLSIEDLAPLRSGFRARYIIDAATKVANKEINFDILDSIPLEDAEKELMKIVGVGLKVADCALLFSCSRIDAFPKDVWIKRAMEKLFDGNLPECAIQYAGIVQQYIFYYARTTKLNI